MSRISIRDIVAIATFADDGIDDVEGVFGNKMLSSADRDFHCEIHKDAPSFSGEIRQEILDLLNNSCGAQKRAAHRLNRLTHERPATERPTVEPTQRWCSDCGKVCANVTGKSAQAVGLHPSLALGLTCTEAAFSRSGQPGTGHPAVAMEQR